MIEASTGIQVAKITSSPNLGEVNKSSEINSVDPIRVSGSLDNHYAPAAKVFLCEIPTVGQGFIALASIETPPGVIRLASPLDDDEFAQILYSALREADIQGLAEVVITQPIGIGIAVAIRDRLVRAANGR
jgi:L-threonylcarbamoyladenylate synthase